MNLKDRIKNYTNEVKQKVGRSSTRNYFRNNFDVFDNLINEMRNQGQGSAYEKISELCYLEGITTKKTNKPISIAYIKDCLIKIRKEKGLKVRAKKRKPKVKEIIKEVVNKIEVIKKVDNSQVIDLQNKLTRTTNAYKGILGINEQLIKESKELNSVIKNKEYEITNLKTNIEELVKELNNENKQSKNFDYGGLVLIISEEIEKLKPHLYAFNLQSKITKNIIFSYDISKNRKAYFSKNLEYLNKAMFIEYVLKNFSLSKSDYDLFIQIVSQE